MKRQRWPCALINNSSIDSWWTKSSCWERSQAMQQLELSKGHTGEHLLKLTMESSIGIGVQNNGITLAVLLASIWFIHFKGFECISREWSLISFDPLTDHCPTTDRHVSPDGWSCVHCKQSGHFHPKGKVSHPPYSQGQRHGSIILSSSCEEVAVWLVTTDFELHHLHENSSHHEIEQ